jgi:FdrA protein
MVKKIIMRKNDYHDSVQLMQVSQQLRTIAGVKQAMIGMGSETNMQILGDLDLLDDEARKATSQDMIIALECVDGAAIEGALKRMEELFREKEQSRKGVRVHRSFDAALKARPDANLCVITLPGEYAAAAARKALEAGLHCCIYSDNVPLEEEREIKELAAAKGLLCMGPDCGAANVNGKALLTASVVRKGPIGVVGASGSGTQEITILAEREGLGVSHAIGTGGKDLNDVVGGVSMLAGIDALEEDDETKVIVLVSRTPGVKTLPKILERVKRCKKPVVAYFIGGDRALVEQAGAISAIDLEDATVKAIALVRGEEPRGRLFSVSDEQIEALVAGEVSSMHSSQRYLRGLFCGGTFCEEAMALLQEPLGGVFSNAPLKAEFKLQNSLVSVKHTIVDLGDEEFTLGRPHPAIDPEPIRKAIIREAGNKDMAVMLIDFILSYAVNPDPVGSIIDCVIEAKRVVAQRGGYLSVVASVCGTENDPQRLSAQEGMLRDAGVVVMGSNAQAARLAGMIAQRASAR